MAAFEREEIERAHRRRIELQDADDWNGFTDRFTEDAVYVEHHEGTFRGREAIRTWLVRVMEPCKGWTFPIEWVAIDGNRIVYKWLNRLPGRRDDGGFFEFAGVTICEYAGGGLFSYQEDVYNFEETLRVIQEWSQARAAQQ